MMYGRETPFMAFARKQGAAVVSDGLGMLVEQAAEGILPVAQRAPRYQPRARKVAPMKRVKSLFWRIVLALFVLLVLYQLWLFAHVCWWIKFNPATSCVHGRPAGSDAGQEPESRTEIQVGALREAYPTI